MKKNAILYIYCIIAVLGFTSCNSKSKKDICEQEKLIGVLIKTDSLSMGLCPYVQTDNIWFLGSYSQIYNCTISTQKNDSIVKTAQAFLRGGGHGEYDKTILALSSDKSLYILNCSSYGNKILSLSRISPQKYKKGIYEPDDFYDLSKLPALRFVVDNFVIQSDSTFLICGAPYNQINHIFSSVNFKNSSLNTLDYWPEDQHHSDDLAKHSVYTDNSKLFCSGNKYLYLCGWERFAFIFTIEKNKVRTVKKLFTNLLDYKEVADRNYAPLKINKQMLQMSANQKAIYALLIEKDKNGEDPQTYIQSQYGNEIWVYDWEGNALRQITLDKVGFRIKVSEDNKYLYLFTNNSKTNIDEIWQYQL